MGPERRVGVAVHANQLGGNALTYLGLVARLRQHDQPRVRVHVDEARAHDVVRRVDRPRGIEGRRAAPEDAHRVVLHAHRAVVAWIPGPVDDESVFDEEIEHSWMNLQPVALSSSETSRSAEKPFRWFDKLTTGFAQGGLSDSRQSRRIGTALKFSSA